MPRGSVLLVDDDIGMVETLADVLRTHAYQVETGLSGEAAVAMTRATRYDAVLMDIRMPGMNGVQALRAFKSWAPPSAVILMTALSRHDLTQEALRESAVVVLPKPLDIDRVLTLLDDAARASRAGRGEAS